MLSMFGGIQDLGVFVWWCLGFELKTWAGSGNFMSYKWERDFVFLMGWDVRFARETDRYTGFQFLPDLMCYGVFLMCWNTVLSIIIGRCSSVAFQMKVTKVQLRPQLEFCHYHCGWDILELHCDLLCNGLWHQWHMPVSNVFHAAQACIISKMLQKEHYLLPIA